MIGEAELQTTRLCVVGNINRDIKTAPLASGEHLFHDGETSVEAISETIGGGGANSACIAAALGAPVSFLGRVGGDRLGEVLVRTMSRHGVECHAHRDQSCATGTTLNLVYASGHRHFISCHPNNEALCFENLNLEAIETADHLLRADIWFSESMLRRGNEQLLRFARDVGVGVSIDLNWDPRWSVADRDEIRRRKQAVRDLLPLVDLVHGNVRELNEFADSDDLENTLGRLGEWGTGTVVVHMGSRGAGYCRHGDLVVEPPARVNRMKAITGTGDVLSVCMMLMHPYTDVRVNDKLRLANAIVGQFIEGERRLIPKVGRPPE